MKTCFKEGLAVNRSAARNLKVLVIKSSKKQEELERVIGLSDSTLYKFSNGNRNIDYDEAVIFCGVF